MKYVWLLGIPIILVAGKFYFSSSETYQASRSDGIGEKIVGLAFVGDIMLDRQVETKIMQNGEDFHFPFLNIANDLNDYDFLFGNLEGPISSRGRNVGSKYSFRMDPKAAEGLKFAGFDALSIANNHSGDWGYEAYNDTIEALKKEKIIPVGATTSPEYFEAGGMKIALFAFSDFPNPGLRATEENIRRIYEAKADIVIASFHFGDEYQKLPSDRQKYLAHLAVDSGADLVIGHHPHVTQTIEQYRGSYIAYSLGNFVFDQYFSEETMRGGLLEVLVKNKDILSVKMREISLNSDYQPALVD